ncbi:substrate-binding domain-containing protein [Chromobacterium sp. ATCC 53434]|uniref:substrate-binding domain-containing protein n=1 Tax=Chromobacterium sp. (strain ATCC 53434 / SC 14030) TaxID=2059672 RepID=UPI0013051C01|nr:substrate-binding domain-containing protein [Chromobacterium sp. ATCC 53434]
MTRLPCLLLFTLSATAAPLPAVQVRGSPALSPLMQRAAEDYMAREPGSSVVVATGSSAFGLKSLLDGNADIAMVHGALPAALRTSLDGGGRATRRIVAGYQALLPVVSPDNPLSDIDLPRLRAVFAGAIADWRELGGAPGAITVLLAPPVGATGQAWRDAVLGSRGRFSPHGLLVSERDWAAQLAGHPGAIAIVTADELGPGLKPLTLSGQRADIESVRAGRYPLRIPLLLVVPETPAPQSAGFIRYLEQRLRQDGGRR